MKKFLLIIAAIFCCTLGANAQETPDYFCITLTNSNLSKNIQIQQKGPSWASTPQLEYSKDAEHWTNVTYGTNISIASDEKVYFRAGQDGIAGTNTTFSQDNHTNYIYVSLAYISTGAAWNVSGNIMSLLDGDDFEDLDAVPDNAFYRLFNSGNSNNTYLTDISDLRLPATNLGKHCYSYMFYKCTNITSAPTLPATTLKEYCYTYMFNGCTNLCDIEVNFTTWPGSGGDDAWGTSSWVGSVAASGTFTCPEDLPHEGSSYFGSSKIPTGWKVEHPTTDITLNDNEPYTGTKDRTVTVTYNRTFAAENIGKYEPLYVPFDIDITADLLEKCEILDIYMVSAGSGSNKGKDVLNVRAMEEGETTKFQTPYIIIPKVADLSFTQDNTVVHGISAVQKPVQCATTKDTYDFIGSYSGETLTVGTDFILTTTNMLPVDEDTKTLAPNRWYMKKISKMDEEPVGVDLKEMKIVVIGEGGATGIEGISLTPALSDGEGAMYNLQGQRVGSFNGYRGVVIKGGKKYILK